MYKLFSLVTAFFLFVCSACASSVPCVFIINDDEELRSTIREMGAELKEIRMEEAGLKIALPEDGEIVELTKEMKEKNIILAYDYRGLRLQLMAGELYRNPDGSLAKTFEEIEALDDVSISDRFFLYNSLPVMIISDSNIPYPRLVIYPLQLLYFLPDGRGQAVLWKTCDEEEFDQNASDILDQCAATLSPLDGPDEAVIEAVRKEMNAE